MRILYLANNWVGWKGLEWLKEQHENVVGLVLHPAEKQKFGEEILRASKLDPKYIFDGSTLRDSKTIKAIQDLKPDVGLSVFFGYILDRVFLEMLPKGCLNLHPAYLPYNRGANPNVWSIVDGTPAGVTLHYVDQGVDTGDIIAQKQVTVEPVDTGARLYRKLEQASLDLLKEAWPHVHTGNVKRVPQSKDNGTVHRMKDVESLDEIDLDRPIPPRQLINILRSRTFPPYGGAYFKQDGKKIYLRVEALYEDELKEPKSGKNDRN